MSVLARRKLNGTVGINGINLPAEDGAEAIERVHHLARSAKADGDPRLITVLRVVIFLGLLSPPGQAPEPGPEAGPEAGAEGEPEIEDEPEPADGGTART